MLEQLESWSLEAITDLGRHVEQIRAQKEAEESKRSHLVREAEELGFEFEGLRPKASVGSAKSPSEALRGKEAYRAYWSYALPRLTEVFPILKNRAAAEEHWFRVRLGVGGISLNMLATGKEAYVEIYINSAAKSAGVFEHLSGQKEYIEGVYGGELVWERMDGKKTCMIKSQRLSCNVYERGQWPGITSFLIEEAQKLKAAFDAPLHEWKTM